MSLLSTEETEHRAREQVGKTLNGKYHLDQLLGVGGMAAVYAATHRNGHRVAIKLLYPELTLSKDVLTRFIREGYAANRVGHPGAVRVLDDDKTDDGSVFLVMELLEGEAVDAIHASRGMRLVVADLLPWMDQLLDVLTAAHQQDIVHRDIKPENLFITWAGTLKVLDFGIARMKSSPNASVTRTGNQFGTPPFMSPEQALGRMKEIDSRSDLYAAGATMFFLLTGEDVHPAESANEMLVLAATRPARSLASILPDIPAPVARVVDRALAFDREERWQDARAMQTALREAYLEVFGEAIPSVPVPLDASHAQDGGRTSVRALKVRSGRSSDAGARAAAETQAVPSSAPDAPAPDLVAAGATDSAARAVKREFHATAPPTSAVAERTPSSRRWLLFVGGGLMAVLATGLYVMRGSETVTPDASLAATIQASSPTPTPSAPAPSAAALPLAAESPKTGTAAPAESAGAAAPSATVSAAAAAPPNPLPPQVRKKPRSSPSTPRPNSDTSAFEHQ
jgi:serine/threonine protein kinase